MIRLIQDIIRNAFKLGKFEIILFFCLLIISTAIEILGVSLIIPLISVLIDANDISKYSEFLDFNFKSKEIFINYIMLFFLLVFTAKYIITIIIEYLIVKYTKNWEIEMIMRLLDRHITSPWLDTIKNQERLLKNILTNIPTFISSGITAVLNIFKSLFILLGIIFFLVYQKGTLVFMIISLFIFIFYFLLKNFKNHLIKISNKYSDYIDIKYDLSDEIKNGLREIKILNLKNFFLKKFFLNEKLIAKTDIIKKIVNILPKIIIEFILIIGFLLIIYFNSEKPEEILPLLGLISFIVYRSQPLLASLVSTLANIQLNTAQINDGMAVINFENKIEKFDKDNNEDIGNLKIDPDCNSVIKIIDLFFSYEQNKKDDKKIFSGLNLSLEFGNIYALSGANGTGKSTLADLITGFLKPNAGEILYNGKNINLFSKKWMNSIAYLSQNFFLFNDTIKNNITLVTKNEKNFDYDKYQEALEATNLKQEFLKFENYDDTILKDSGKKLSGGQKQRIALARMVYKNSKLIILDEPTASLDKESSDLMFKMLQKIKKNKLIIIISHSQEILKKSDKIIKIDNKIISLLDNE